MKFYKRVALLIPAVKKIYSELHDLRKLRETLEPCDGREENAENEASHPQQPADMTVFPDYRNYAVNQIDYGKVDDYCDSMDKLRNLTDIHKDLKDVQRPWIVKAILSKIPPGSKLLEIGAGEPIVADALSKYGYEVCVVDPYDGTGNGPVEYEDYLQRFPNVTILRKFFTSDMDEFKEDEFDCIYSVSVLEHIEDEDFPLFFNAVEKYLKRDGYSIHAIDYIRKGMGCEASHKKMKVISNEMHLNPEELEDILCKSDGDVNTFYLSPFGYYLWKSGLSCEEYPMKKIISLHLCGMKEVASIVK